MLKAFRVSRLQTPMLIPLPATRILFMNAAVVAVRQDQKMIQINQLPSTDRGARNGRFDYVIVGAGSGGCVVARRLLDNTDATVLLLEAGGAADGSAIITDPERWTENFGSQYAWTYAYEPNPSVDGRIIKLARGKVLGGSGSINAMAWARGNRADYDGWAIAGNAGWDYESILPLFKQSEDWEDGESHFRGAGGPMHIERANAPSLVSNALMDACTSYGMPFVHDLNGPEPMGIGPMQMNISNGVRCSPWDGFMHPVRKNDRLTVLTGAHVIKLRFSGTRCTGVDYLFNGQYRSAHALAETILAAGAFDTPRLLLLSGIGPQDGLKPLGIPVLLELRGVGQNLQDHINLTGMYFEAKPMGERLFRVRGRNVGFWKSRPGLAVPDLMFSATGILPTKLTGRNLAVPANAFAIRPALVRIASRGSLRLRTAAFDDAMYIQPNFLVDRADVDALVAGVEIGLELATQPAFRELIKAWIDPAKRTTRAEAEAFLRRACNSYSHPVGTCAMGSGREAVVDNELRVHGIERLRIADASIMPTIPSANTHAATIMIGEFAARMIASV
jgi:choline dehydrogenase